MPDAIDARLASLTLSGVDIGEFDPARTDYEGSRRRTACTVDDGRDSRGYAAPHLAIDPPDADGDANGHRLAEITSRDLGRWQPYEGLPRAVPRQGGIRPAIPGRTACGEPSLRGSASSSTRAAALEELVSCAESRGIVALYALHDGAYVSYILGAPTS